MDTDHIASDNDQNSNILKNPAEQSFDVINILNFVWHIMCANPAAKAFYWSPKNLHPRNCAGALFGQPKNLIIPYKNATADRRASLVKTKRWISFFRIAFCTIAIENQRTAGMLGIVMNLTTSQETKAVIDQSEVRYRAVLENMLYVTLYLSG
jgi:hypothetical protein